LVTRWEIAKKGRNRDDRTQTGQRRAKTPGGWKKKKPKNAKSKGRGAVREACQKGEGGHFGTGKRRDRTLRGDQIPNYFLGDPNFQRVRNLGGKGDHR